MGTRFVINKYIIDYAGKTEQKSQCLHSANYSIDFCIARCHTQNDIRRYIALSTFGFYQKGKLDVKMTDFQIEDGNLDDTVSHRLCYYSN